MEALTLVNKKFSSISFRVKAQLYLLCLLLVVFYFSFNFKENIKYANTFPAFQNSYTFSSIDLISKIETYANLNKFDISSIDIKNKTISLNFISNLKKINEFILFIENLDTNSNIDFFELTKTKNNYFQCEVKIDFHKTFIKTLKSIKKTENLKVSKLKLDAIIDKYVFINDKWREVGQNFDSYKIIDIQKNSVTLIKDEKEINIKVYHEKYFK